MPFLNQLSTLTTFVMQERRLAAIMLVLHNLCEGRHVLRSLCERGSAHQSTNGGWFIDIVGYTILYGMDKDQTFQLLCKNRKIQKTIFEKYRGEWLKRCIDKRESLFRFLNICPTKSHHILDEHRPKELMNKTGIEEFKADFERDQKVGYNPT